MTPNPDHLRTFALAAAVIVALATFPASAETESTGTCAEAAVPEAFTLPDGTTVEAGTLRLCFTRRYSPAAGLHEVRIDGRPVGMFLSERRRTEGIAELGDALVVLRRRTDGSLALYAYAVRDGDRMVAYKMRPTGPRARRAMRDLDRGTPDLATLLGDRPDGFTFLAALR